MTTRPYQLAEDVYFCLSDNRIVFLDLRRNQYLCLNRRNTQTAISLLTGSTGSDVKPRGEKHAADRTTDTKDARLLVRVLTEKGLLTQDGINGKEAVSLRIQSPENTMLPEGRRSTPIVSPAHWAGFIHASLTASWKLRWYSMQRTVESIQHRNERCVLPQVKDRKDLRELVAIFHHLRPYYVRKYLCLYDSLALVEFLARYGLFPQWVFGVTAEPFNAHCWVQEQNCVLNDTVEYVRGFTPIMTI